MWELRETDLHSTKEQEEAWESISAKVYLKVFLEAVFPECYRLVYCPTYSRIFQLNKGWATATLNSINEWLMKC